jgi:hypothetical protein
MTMDTKDIVTILVAFASGFIAPLIKDYWQRKSRRKVETEADLDISDAAQKIVNGSASAVGVMEGLLKRYETKLKDQDRDIKNLKARITAMQIEEKNREKAEGERNNAIADQIDSLGKYIKVLIDTLREHDIPIPPRPKALKDRDTLDKIRAIKWPIKPGETIDDQ